MPDHEDRKITSDEMEKHSTADDCWIVVEGIVWDLSEFAPDHPGGAGLITRHAGKDATAAYTTAHPLSLLTSTLPPSKRLGTLDLSTLSPCWAKPPPRATPELAVSKLPPLDSILNLHDFEAVAAKMLIPKTHAFYSSAATDLVTKRNNADLLQRIWLRPRVLRNVAAVDTSSALLGHKVQLPLFVSPSALARLAHPDGEKALARACAASGIVQCISTNASYPIEEIVSAAPAGQVFFFQLYVNKERSKTEQLLRKVMGLRGPDGAQRIRGILVTVDAAVPGKREADERLKADETLQAPNSGAAAKNDKRGGGLGRVMGAYIDAGLCWEDLVWLRGIVGWEMPILLKGVQTAEDALLAVRAGCQGVVVSNHGGRSLDTASAAIIVLLELRRRCPEVFTQLEVWVDGGIRRGTDIMKCLALGAKGIGLGRPFLYSLCYGQEGAEHLVEILRDELETTMRLMGVTKVEEIGEECVNTRDIEHLVPGFGVADVRSRGWLGRLFGSRL